MLLRSFKASTMQEAMQLVRDALGHDAVIVSSHVSKRGRGVQLMAALDSPEADLELLAVVDDQCELLDEPHPLHSALTFHALPEAMVRRLCKAAAVFNELEPSASLGQVLEHYFSFATLDISADAPIMLVGPSGAGKTTLAAKLATRAVLAGKSTHIVTTDTIRAGAVAQLAAYAKLLEQPLVCTGRPDEFAGAVADADPESLVIVDTPGANPFDRGEIDDLARFIDAVPCTPVLVMPGGTDTSEAAEIAANFARLPIEKMVVTRLDASRRLGNMLAAAEAADVSLTEASISPSIGQGLYPLKPLTLAHLLLRDPLRSDVASLFGELTL